MGPSEKKLIHKVEEYLGEKSKKWSQFRTGEQARKKRRSRREYIFYSTCENSRRNWLGCCYLFASEIQILPIWLKAQRDLLPVVTDKTRAGYSFSLAWKSIWEWLLQIPIVKRAPLLKIHINSTGPSEWFHFNRPSKSLFIMSVMNIVFLRIIPDHQSKPMFSWNS